jgi:hypothetical protein
MHRHPIDIIHSSSLSPWWSRHTKTWSENRRHKSGEKGSGGAAAFLVLLLLPTEISGGWRRSRMWVAIATGKRPDHDCNLHQNVLLPDLCTPCSYHEREASLNYLGFVICFIWRDSLARMTCWLGYEVIPSRLWRVRRACASKEWDALSVRTFMHQYIHLLTLWFRRVLANIGPHNATRSIALTKRS